LRARREVVAVALAAYLIVSLVAVLSTRSGDFSARTVDLAVGMVVPEDIIVQRDVVYTDERATALKRDARLRLVPPVFQLNATIVESQVAALQLFRSAVVEGFTVNAEARNILARLESSGVIGRVTEEEIAALALQPDHEAVIDNAAILLQEVMNDGVFRSEDLVVLRSEITTAGAVELQRGGKAWQEIPLGEIQTLGTLSEHVADRTEGLSLTEGGRRLVVRFVSRFAEENCFYDQVATQEERTRAANEVEPVQRSLVEGQVIARKGDLVTEDLLEKIRAHGEDTFTSNLNSLVGTVIFLAIVLFLSAFLYTRRVVAESIPRSRAFLLIGLSVGYFVIAMLLRPLAAASDWLPASVAVPTAVFTMLIALLISLRAGVLSALVFGLLQLQVSGMEVDAFLFAFLSGVAGCAAAEGAESRLDLIRAGLILSVYASVVLLVLGLIANFETDQAMQALFWGFGNGFASGLLTLSFLPILEYLLNAPTRFRLMELSDLNAPIFKKMLNVAPGTYHHTLLLANLAETACKDMGANALLARVGAYYHDIGKIDQPEYFIENQTEGNKHDNLKPNLSAAIIKAHVKIGIEKARDLGLPDEVIDFVAQHHGKQVISYFYQRALDRQRAEDEEKGEGKGDEISSDDYSYPGERPRSRETAVVMLADAVEASTRTLKRPTVAKLDRAVWDIILERFESGELSETPLTFKDLETIKRSFVQVLAGHFHSRIEYPKKKAPAR
jgi:putative nucleotidyltransferase with HDIG domain